MRRHHFQGRHEDALRLLHPAGDRASPAGLPTPGRCAAVRATPAAPAISALGRPLSDHSSAAQMSLALGRLITHEPTFSGDMTPRLALAVGRTGAFSPWSLGLDPRGGIPPRRPNTEPKQERGRAALQPAINRMAPMITRTTSTAANTSAAMVPRSRGIGRTWRAHAAVDLNGL
jgi:hypothetical protein